MFKIIDYFLKKIKFSHKHISIQDFNNISTGCFIKIINGGSIEIGKNCWILDHAMLLSYGGKIKIGDNCSVNPYTILYGHGGLTIGNSVRIAAHTVIIPSNHKFQDKSLPIYKQGHSMKGIIIEDDVWIGANCTILDGVILGKGSVIGAGSVVTKSIPSFSIAVGVPARVLSKRE